MNHAVFISYSSKDRAPAEAVCAELERQGIGCWIAPRDITAGRTWGDSIIEAINRARIMVIILSSHSNQSPQVLREVERAVSKGVVVIPFRIEDILPSGAMEYFLGSQHWLDAFTDSVEEHARQLVRTVSLLLKEWAGPEEGDRPASPPPAFAGGRLSRVFIYNTSSALTHLRTGSVEVEIDGSYVGLLRRKEYAETLLPPGEHTISLRHRDVTHWENTYTIAVDGPTVYVAVYAAAASTKFRIASKAPAFFERKYRRMEEAG